MQDNPKHKEEPKMDVLEIGEISIVEPTITDLVAVEVWKLLRGMRFSNPFNKIYIMDHDNQLRIVQPNEVHRLVESIYAALPKQSNFINTYRDMQLQLDRANIRIHQLNRVIQQMRNVLDSDNNDY